MKTYGNEFAKWIELDGVKIRFDKWEYYSDTDEIALTDTDGKLTGMLSGDLTGQALRVLRGTCK